MRWSTAMSPTRLRPRSPAATRSTPRINPADVAVTNTDNDAAAITVTPITGLVTTEARRHGDLHRGADERADRRRDDQPELERRHRGHGPGAALTFTAANFSVAQTVTVTGVDDALVDGNVAYTIATTVTSGDAIYAAINPADVAVTNTDNDAAGITVTPTTGLTTTEAGGTATFTVVLTSAPTGDVTINLSSSDTTEGTVAGEPHLHRRQLQRGADRHRHRRRRCVVDGDVPYTIATTVTSGDAIYAAINPADVAVTNTDNDAAAITVTPMTGLTTTEAPAARPPSRWC